jgi:hypothetical protein
MFFLSMRGARQLSEMFGASIRALLRPALTASLHQQQSLLAAMVAAV